MIGSCKSMTVTSGRCRVNCSTASAVVGLGHDGHVRLYRDDARQPFTQQAVVIDDQQANRSRHVNGPHFTGRGTVASTVVPRSGH